MLRQRLSVNAADADLVEEIRAGARELKKKVYGNRISTVCPS
ncbi:MAG: hypothetical protein U5L72_02415 [Bacteroidales bacterium]|nr:hypothetical protein [Bacteroidales bacterium]